MEGAFHLAGLAWWLVIPLALGLAWAIGMITAREVAALPRGAARWLIGLRCAAVAVVVLFLLEPAYSRAVVRRELPAVAVFIDHSASMALDDRGMHPSRRLDEAEALELLPSGLRAEAGRGLATALRALARDLPELARSVATPLAPAQLRQVTQRFADHRAAIAQTRVGTLMDAQGDLDAVQRLCDDALSALTAPLSQGIDHAGLAAQVVALIPTVLALSERAQAAQRAADTALVAGAEGGSPVARALDALAARSRLDRARALVERHLQPALVGVAEVEIFAAGGANTADGAPPTPLTAAARIAAGGATDLGGPLAWIARIWSNRHLGAVVWLSDGRQTAGPDPVPVARALAARGARVHTVALGDPDLPRDAVIAAIAGPSEVFRGESVHLDVRWRVSGFADRPWDVVLACEGEEVARTTVRGDGTWQVSRFEVPAGQLPEVTTAPVTFQARIEPNRPSEGEWSIRAGGGLLREIWQGVGGSRLADFFLSGIAPRRADVRTVIDQARVVDGRENFASRLRGWLIPPETGTYTFWIAGDDETELWLGVSGTPYDRVRIASVPEWTNPEEWDRFAAQRSAGIHLVAGQPVYVEVLHKQGSGASHMALGWQTPSNRLERPLPTTVLAPWAEGASADAEPGDDDRPEASLINNRAELAVLINEDPLRVLVVDHHPRWDMRYISALFARDRRIEVVRRYHAVRLPRGEQELLPLDQAALDAFDLVVLGDLAPGEWSADDQQRLATYVGRRGGFLVTVAGPRGMPWGYSLGALAEVLPVRSGVTSDARRLIRLALAEEGQHHPVTRILDDQLLNQQLWSELPAVQWAATSVTAKPGAQVLVRSADAAKAPIIAVGRYGAGRVAWIGTDETWRWRDPLGDRVHQSFWTQLMRWGLGSRLRGADRRLQVALDRALIQLGDVVDVRARLLDEAGAPTGRPQIQLVRIDETGAEIIGSRIDGAFGRVADTDVWSQRLTGLAEGRWRITVSGIVPELVEVRELLVARRASVEGVELGADATTLARIADAGGGIATDATGVAELGASLVGHLAPRTSERRMTISLWQSHGALLLVLLLLVGEWSGRKRRGLP